MDSTLNQHYCNNCGNEFTKGFCNNCGQKVSHRITLGHIWHDFVHAFTHADKGIFHLFLQLFVRPGIVAREYIIEGKRKKYFNPFQYILIIGSIAAFVAVNSHFMDQFVQSTGTAAGSARQAAFMTKMTQYQSKYYNVVLLLQLPFVSFASWLLFKKWKLNYAEHLTLNTFVTAQNAILGMVMMTIMAITKIGLSVGVMMSVISIAYNVFALTQFFQVQSIGGVFRALISNLLGMFFFMIFVAIITFVVVLVMVSKSKGH